MTEFLMIFIGLSIINVVFSTVRTIVTIKGGKLLASLMSGGYFAFYNIVMMWTVADFPMWQKCAITFVCNVIGVYIVKLAEEKARKDKVWLVKMTIPTKHAEQAKYLLEQANIPFTYYDLNKYFVFDTFCETQMETATATKICSTCCGKAFATENKLGL